MTFAVTSNDPFTMSGSYFQTGTLFSMANATYSLAGKTMTATVTPDQGDMRKVSKAPGPPNVGAAYPGCVETGYFSLLFLPS